MDKEYELYHHGILGMHWGIRRLRKNNHGSDNRRSTTSASKTSADSVKPKKSISSLEDTHKRLLERSRDPRYGPKVHNAYQQILMNYSNRMRILEEASDHFKRKGDTKTYLEVQNRIRDTNKELIKTMYEVDQIADQVSARYGIK